MHILSNTLQAVLELPDKFEKLANGTYIMETKKRDKTVAVSCTALNDKCLRLSVGQFGLLIYAEVMLQLVEYRIIFECSVFVFCLQSLVLFRQDPACT